MAARLLYHAPAVRESDGIGGIRQTPRQVFREGVARAVKEWWDDDGGGLWRSKAVHSILDGTLCAGDCKSESGTSGAKQLYTALLAMQVAGEGGVEVEEVVLGKRRSQDVKAVASLSLPALASSAVRGVLAASTSEVTSQSLFTSKHPL